MTLHIYALKNRLTGLYSRPITEQYKPEEYEEFLIATLANASLEDLNLHKEYDVYYLGEFDTKSAVINYTKVEFVLSLESICLNYISKKVKVDNDGKE